MIIPNHKDIYKAVAEKYDLDLELVEKIGSFTWGDLNERISDFKNREIYMYKLGVWKFRKLKGQKYVDHLRKEISSIRKNPDLLDKDKERLIARITDKITKLVKLLREWEEIIEQRNQFKNEQNQDIRNIPE